MNKCTPRLISTNLDNGLVELCWSDTVRSVFHPIWLRDNCRCEYCGDPATGYRNLRLTTLDLNGKPQTLTAEATQLRIIWQDQHETVFSSAWLRAHAYDEASRAARVFKPTLWDQLERGDFHSSLRIIADRLGLPRDTNRCCPAPTAEPCTRDGNKL